MKRRMGAFDQLGAGLLIGFIISFVVAYIAFQAELFRQGAESIGVTFWGFCYFFGGLVISTIFWILSKGKTPGRYLSFFGIAIVVVGSIGLNNVLAGASSGGQLDMQVNVELMARLLAQIVFWGGPIALVIFYGFALVENQPKNNK
jgi:hypothetical protein